MNIREIIPADLPQALELYKGFLKYDAWGEEYANFVTYFGYGLYHDGFAFYVAEEGDELIGCILAELKHNEYGPNGIEYGNLYYMYVKEDYRRQGIATRLVDKAIKWLKRWQRLHIVKLQCTQNPDDAAPKVLQRVWF